MTSDNVLMVSVGRESVLLGANKVPLGDVGAELCSDVKAFDTKECTDLALCNNSPAKARRGSVRLRTSVIFLRPENAQGHLRAGALLFSMLVKAGRIFG